MKEIYSIWHSVKKWEDFLEELLSINFDYLVDIRSYPYSRFVPQYNKKNLQTQLLDKYIFMGDSLWWMDDDINYEQFTIWLNKLSDLAKDHTVVFFCSERDYRKCHRYFKVTPELEVRWFKVIHL